MFTMTLIRTHPVPALGPAHIALAQGALEAFNIRADNRPPMWMQGRKAVRGWLLDRPTPEQMALLRARLEPAGVDVICEAYGLPKLRLACFDLESTCLENESMDLLGERLGHGPEIAVITARAMNGEISMRAAFETRIAMLKGVGQRDIDAVLAQLVPFPHMKDTIAWLRAQGVHCALITGAAQSFAQPMAARYGFDSVDCSHFNLLDGCFDGTCDILTVQGKADAALRLIDTLGIDPQETLAMGDGANDEAMMGVVGRPFGWRPKPTLSRVTPNQLNFADWRGLRYALA